MKNEFIQICFLSNQHFFTNKSILGTDGFSLEKKMINRSALIWNVGGIITRKQKKWKKHILAFFAVQWSNVVEAEPKDQSSQNRRKKDPKDKSTKKEKKRHLKQNRFQYWKIKLFCPKQKSFEHSFLLVVKQNCKSNIFEICWHF